MSDLMYNPTNGSLFNKRGMKSIEKLKFLDSLEDIYRYTGPDALAVFYPSRVLPSVYIDTDAEWPIVMPPGLIVSSKNIKDAQAYASGETETGILTSGEVYVTIDMEGTAQKMSINYLYPNEIAGILVPANGGDASALSYSDNDGEYGIVLANGAAADADADDLSISANVPIGIVNGRVYADLRERYQGYDKSHAVSVQRGGVLTLPYVLIYGAGVTATVLAAVRSAVNAKHQYVWFSGSDADTVEGYLENGTLLKSDLYGRFTRWDSSSDDQNQIFGEVVGLRNRVPYALDEIIDSFPGSGAQGTDTGGLPSRLYNFITSIMAKTDVKPADWTASKANIKSLLYEAVTTNTANVSIVFGQVDVAFGTARK